MKMIIAQLIETEKRDLMNWISGVRISIDQWSAALSLEKMNMIACQIEIGPE